MPKIPVDLTVVNVIPDGPHVATINKVDYQIKTGESWNSEGTETVQFDTWIGYPADVRRLHITLQPVGFSQNLWHDLYMKPTALGFVKDFFKAAGAPIGPDGFDAEDLINKQVLITLVTKDEGYGERQNITKVKRV